jgi:hypothetical protein
LKKGKLRRERKKAVKRRRMPLDARVAYVAGCFWFLCVFAR